MNGRRHGRKPALALWMLVALADAAIVTAATGVLTMVLILGIAAVVAGGVFAARAVTRRDATGPEAVARRRA
jgi:hypothetical protein